MEYAFEVQGLTPDDREDILDDFWLSRIERIDFETDNVTVGEEDVDEFTDYLDDLGVSYRLV
jgi:hypothetical protein